jgi:hypothetical protein
MDNLKGDVMPLRHALSFAIGLSIILFFGGLYIGVSYSDRVAPTEVPIELPTEGPTEVSCECLLGQLVELEKTGWEYDVETQYGKKYRCWLRSKKNGVEVSIFEYGDDLNDTLKKSIQKARRLDLHPECPGVEDE